MPRHSIGVIPIESSPKALLLHPGVPTFTVAEYRKAHQSGRFGCGSCGELMPPGHGFEYLERDYEPDTVITIQLTHNYYLDNERPEDYVPAAEAPAPIHAILYEEGTRETYVLNGDGRHERLFGIVYREAAAPERPYREIWYPTCEFRTPEEVRDAEA